MHAEASLYPSISLPHSSLTVGSLHREPPAITERGGYQMCASYTMSAGARQVGHSGLSPRDSGMAMWVGV